MGKVFSKEQLQTIRMIRKGYLTAILIVLVIELVSWVLVILFSKSTYDATIGKMQTMFLAFVGCALLNVGAFRCLELGGNKSRAFAITSLITAVIATILDLFLIWEIVPLVDDGPYDSYNHLTVMAKFTLSTALTAITTLIEANIIMPGKTDKTGRIIASSALGFFYVCLLVSIIGIDLKDKFALLVTVVPIGSLLIYYVATRITNLEKVSEIKMISEEMSDKGTNKDAMLEREKAMTQSDTIKKEEQPVVGHDPKTVPDSVYPEIKKD